MAFKPSARKKQDNDYKEPDMLVIMNLMVCLIPLLLSCAEFVKMGTIEINLPTDSGGGGGGSSASLEKAKKLDLKVLITEAGFTIQSTIRGIEKGPVDNASIPVKPGSYDLNVMGSYKEHYPFDELNAKLVAMKKEIAGQGFTDETNVQITAGNNVPYQVLVKTMDTVKAKYDKNKEVVEVLFTNISLGVTL
ncbi:MAG: biopolymer transporter ExbD [Bacteroidetes bacterium]|nr:biopolymer transporter ExbD [Bacteroidota bacterium]